MGDFVMTQAVRKESNNPLSEENKKAFIEFLRKIKQNKVTVTSYTPNKIEFIDQNNQKHIIIKQGNKYIEMEKRGNIITPEFPKTDLIMKPIEKPKPKKLKTKKGKVIAPNIMKILAPPLIVAGALSIAHLSTNHNEMLNSEIEVLDPEEEATNLVGIDMKNWIEDSMEKQKNLEISEPVFQNLIITQTTCVEVLQQENMIKREQTDALFGEMIDAYASHYGIPNSIGKALISQERPNDTYENLGQLTRNICGEKIILPVMDQTSNELEKIYIVREEPNKENYKTEASYKEQLDKYKNQLEESKKLKEEGYQIYSFQEIIENPEMNIHIAMAYLAHCVYKCDMNITQGIRAYNSGYTAARKASDEEIANGKIEIGDAEYNKHVFSHLYADEINDMVWRLKSVPKLTESEKRTMTKEQIQKKEIEMAKNTPMIVVNVEFSRIKELYYEEENGYHL